MRYRELGTTGLRVSRLCLGTTEMGGDWGRDYDRALGAARRAYELGINFFDTAYAYGDAEASLARAMRDVLAAHRQDLVISTKGGLEVHGSGSGRSLVRNSDADRGRLHAFEHDANDKDRSRRASRRP